MSPSSLVALRRRWSVRAVLQLLVALSLLGCARVCVEGFTYAPLAGNASCLPTYGVQWVAGNIGGTVLPVNLNYPLVATYVHQGPSPRTPTVLYGGISGAVQSTVYSTADGFQTFSAVPRVDSTVGPLYKGNAGWLANGNIVLISGLPTTTASTTSGTVYVSTDGGASFNVSTTTAGFGGKYQAQMLAIPFTNTLVLIGGYNAAGAETADIWISTDGFGAVWTLQAATSPIPTNALAGAVALYDSSHVNPTLYSSPNSTIIFFLEYDSGEYWTSYDLGRSWSVNYVSPLATAFSDVTHRDWILFTADMDNNIYGCGVENNPDSQLWMSSTMGQTWSLLTQSMSIPHVPTSVYLQWAQWSVMYVQYNATTLAKQLVIVGYQNWMSDGSIWASLVGQLNVPSNVTGYGTLPNATIASSTTAGALPSVQSPACAYNVHSLTASPLFVSVGGLNGSTVMNAAYTSVQGATWSLAASAATATGGVYNAGAAVLANGNLLLIGGLLNATTATAAVWISANNGSTWSISAATAAFGARSSFATCVMPGSNAVLVIGGYLNGGSTASNDVYLSTDGQGAVWTRVGSLPVANAGGSCVLMYDNAAFARGASVNSTLLVLTSTNRIYRSLSLGSSFASTPSLIGPGAIVGKGYTLAPFSTQTDTTGTRYQTALVADYDGHLYASGARGIFDNGLYFSGDVGFTWYRLRQISTLGAGVGNYIQASTACLGMAYAASGSSYVKTLTLYGGLGVHFDSGMSYSAIQWKLDASPAALPSATTGAANVSAMAAAGNAAQVWCVDPARPSLQWFQSTGSSTLPFLQYPYCAANVHTTNSSTPVTLYLYGGSTTAAVNTAGLYASNNGFSTLLPQSHTADATVGARRDGMMALLANGNLLIIGGQTGTTAATATSQVFLSTNGGANFTLVNQTSLPAKYNAQLLVLPGTSWMVMIGGYNAAGAETSDIWLSTDGSGANWRLQTAAGPIPTTALAAAVALYDSRWVNPSLYSTPNSTLIFFLEYASGATWQSQDLGRTWSTTLYVPFATAANSIGHRDWPLATVDRDNVVIVLGMYNEPDGVVWYSPTKGQSFLQLLIAPSAWPGISSYTQMLWASYGCAAVQYGVNARSGNVSKQLVVYGYYTYLSDGSQQSAIVANLPNIHLAPLYPTPPTATLSSSLPQSSVGVPMYPACAYNVHARNGAMVAMGGVTNASAPATVVSILTASTNSFASANASTLSSTSTGGAVVPTYAGGLSLLYNSNLLYYGGWTASGAVSNAVYLSSSQTGIAFSVSTGTAPWAARANFITCTQPFSNYVLVIGGQSATAQLNDVWSSSDGQGSSWSALPAAPWGALGVVAGTCVFLYDSALVPGGNSTQSFSTLLVFTQYNHYYRSTTGGSTWVSTPNPAYPGGADPTTAGAPTTPSPSYQIAPWSTQFDTSLTRLGVEVVADFDNRLYSLAGTGIYDNSAWWSGDLAFTWYPMR